MLNFEEIFACYVTMTDDELRVIARGVNRCRTEGCPLPDEALQSRLAAVDTIIAGRAKLKVKKS